MKRQAEGAGKKTVLERKGPSTFKSAVELISKTELRVHRNLEATVDILLAGRAPQYEVRKRNHQSREGSTEIEYVSSTNGDASYCELRHEISVAPVDERNDQLDVLLKCNTLTQTSEAEPPIRVFIHGILETTVMQGIKKLRLNHAVDLIDNVSEADAVLAPQSKFKRNPQLQAVVDSHDIPVYVTKTGSLVQVMKAIRSLMDDHEDKQREFELGDESSLIEKTDALEEARLAVEHVVVRKGEPVELLPRPLDILLLQIKLAQSYHLQTEILGKGPEDKRLRILPSLSKAESNDWSEDDEVEDAAEYGLHELLGSSGEWNGLPRSVDRLPLLPDYPSA